MKQNWKRALAGHLSWISAFALAGGLFWLSALPLRLLDPTAGTYDAGVLQAPLLAVAWLVFGLGVVLLGIQLWFPTIDRWIDDGHWRAAWQDVAERDPRFALLYVLGVIALFLVAYLVLVGIAA
jgi:hypothetical protein